MAEKIKLLIVDDHDLVREGLRAILGFEQDMQLVGECRDGLEAVEKAAELNPDVILMDLEMPRMGGLQAIRDIRARDGSTRILVLTSFSDDDMVYSAIEAGALGYMLKDTSAATLMQAIRVVYNHEPSLHPRIQSKLMKSLSRKSEPVPEGEAISPREKEILALLGKGMSNQDIADTLGISELTVRSHMSTIMRKLDVENRVQAALYALRMGMARL
jgi:DNA-binding NarL/FixJ family response regulator